MIEKSDEGRKRDSQIMKAKVKNRGELAEFKPEGPE